MKKALKINMASGLVSIFFISIFMSSIGGVPLVFSENNHSDSQISFKGYDPRISAYEKDTLTKVINNYNSKVNMYVPSNEYTFYSHTMITDASMKRSCNGFMNSSWPMRSHDIYRTGRSPYSTIENPLIEKWRFPADDWICGSPVIDMNEIIYFGGMNLFAVHSNGTLKWKAKTGGVIESTPAIDENGIIYVGTVAGSPNHFYAFYTNGTVKFSYSSSDIFSSPVIGRDGVIYYGEYGYYINALYPNETMKWRYFTGGPVFCSPAIGEDGIIYCGSHDHNLYAFYPNGTKKWQFPTGDWIRASPSIAADGTIYVGSYDDYLYALYPNGTLKWNLKVGYGCDSNPSIADDGTIYVGSDKLYAVNPDGTLKWSCDLGTDRYIAFSCPAISVDGTIFVGLCIGNGVGGELLAVNPDGTELWRSGSICNEGIWSSPAIAVDGTVYIGSLNDFEEYPGGFISRGYLHAFGPGLVKKGSMVEPQNKRLYFFGKNLLPLLKDWVVVFGSVSVSAQVTGLEELDHLSFLIDDKVQYNCTEPPFEWVMNKNYNKKHIVETHLLRITAFYKGGCESSESRIIDYFHFLRN
jgi:outer membrane protein assembly factor BamB